MGTLLFVIIILVAIGLVIAALDLYASRGVRIVTQSSNPRTVQLPPKSKQESKTVESPTNVIPRFDLGYKKSRNSANNQHKAAIKARRQGKLRYYFHGNYYPTGLIQTITNGGK